ncbi:Xaa-Pro peptidase family protein [Defluviimonas sp. WL0002]|uniref:Xaa-Pro peptidase family protein n=1 Tax=Albidovulum marisflavi TaxID=2984159 RepID=A0ABT2ZDB7_9RHOB|nr:Xaa-Pro peptidase family protein [Defluviimonas sp. WL0002]MCV2869058.1 Xaa-Pro peptidase family protein [Defluviimonas sp. WL0002]
MFKNPFSDKELARRVSGVRVEMAARGLDIAVFSAPESVFYLTGLDHWGYFAPHHLIVPADGEMVLVTRQMERVTIENQVRNARFSGHSDSVTPASHLAGELGSLSGKRVGFETSSSGFSFAAGREIAKTTGAGQWDDITDLTDALRLVKSPEEQAIMRAAARASDAGTLAAIAAIRDGAREADVAAECTAAMIRAGSNPPGFGPFIRPDHRIAEEHTTWGDGTYINGGRVMLELAGCVSRYHAPMGRLIHLGHIRDEDAEMAEISKRAFAASLNGLRPGRRARDVYADWQAVVDDAGLPHYRRHHCGYLVGIGFPPSWTGGNKVTGLRHDSDLEIKEGMSFHLLSWFTETGRGDFFVSNCALLGPNGPELLTNAPMGPTVL